MTLDEMKDYVRGRDIILVGNSLEALEYEHGDYIDGFDVAVRFGQGLTSPVVFDRLGTNTNVWVTGQLRMNLAPSLPEGTKILFNESRFAPEGSRPTQDYLSMYSDERIQEISASYNVQGGKRLSAGAITAHWFANVCNTWNSMTFINFDVFTQVTRFYADNSESYQYTGSWHLPMLRTEIIPEDYSIESGSLAHDSTAETALYREILELPDTHWNCPALRSTPKFKLKENALVKWLPGRTTAPVE